MQDRAYLENLFKETANCVDFEAWPINRSPKKLSKEFISQIRASIKVYDAFDYGKIIWGIPNYSPAYRYQSEHFFA